MLHWTETLGNAKKWGIIIIHNQSSSIHISQNLFGRDEYDATWVLDQWLIYTWNPTDPCFGWKRPCFGGLTFKSRGHWGSRYIYIYINPHLYLVESMLWLFGYGPSLRDLRNTASGRRMPTWVSTLPSCPSCVNPLEKVRMVMWLWLKDFDVFLCVRDTGWWG